jgi:hypothetical protein
MAILTIYQNQKKNIKGTDYYLCNFYNIKMNNEYWLSITQINEINNKINNLKIKYIDQYANKQSHDINQKDYKTNNQDQTLDNLINEYANFEDCKT